MIKIPNYNVVVPVTPDLRLFGKQRLTYEGDRGQLSFSYSATDSTRIPLPWIPTATEWIEVYVNDIRLINPRVTSDIGGSYFEVFNYNNGVLQFSVPITGELTIICDTKATHWWGSVIVDAQNVQAEYELKTLNNFNFNQWPVLGGTVNGLTYRIFYQAGVKFESNSYVIVKGCEPTSFNGNFRVNNGTLGSVNFRGNVAGKTTMVKPGTISGFGNGVVKKTNGIALYSEPVIITQPRSGYARLTSDRKNIAYVPNFGYVGQDTFSWAMINQHGQISEPKCVNITITAR
jgi:hypothetical protein